MMVTPVPVYNANQIREIEELAYAQDITPEMLMRRAAKAIFDFILRRYPAIKNVMIVCGSGNNGGDGYVLAELLSQLFTVTVYHTDPPTNEPAKNAYFSCTESQAVMKFANELIDAETPDLIVDAICGIGLHTPLRDETISLLKTIEKIQAPVVAIDIPTGINSDTGEVLGYALKANATVTFLGLKLGLLTGAGTSYAGEIVLHQLDVPSALIEDVPYVAEKIQSQSFVESLKPRLKDWHKGLSGHVLIVGGDVGYGGAVRMAAAAALRVGAGLVSVATHPDNAQTLAIGFPEMMCHSIKYLSQLHELMERASVIVLGPGLRTSKWAKSLFSAVTQQKIPLVIDADGLNLLAHTRLRNENWILTPHAGEAARLLKSDNQTVQADRLKAAQEINRLYGGVCVLKGAGTLVTMLEKKPGVCDKGNPGMSTAGMGDILSGVLGGLLAQGMEAFCAAELGVYIHAAAGDIAARDGERGMIATDLLPHLRKLVNYTTAY